MAHEVESMMYTGAVPWHGLGTRIERAPTVEEAIVAAGLDWRVSLHPLMARVRDTVVPVPQRALVRDTDLRHLGTVGPGYEPLQNREAFDFFQPFLDAGEAEIHTAGSLRGGERVWVLAKLNRRPLEIGRGDEVEKFIMLSNGHDGLMAVRTGFTPIRVVCANTLAMAHGENRSQLIRVRHVSGVVGTLDKVREIMNLADQKFEATAEQYRLLTNKRVNGRDLEKYVRAVFNMPKREDEAERQASKIVESIIRLAEAGRGSQLATAKGTYWGAYNALNEYLGYERGKSADIRMDNLWFGQAANTNERALHVATEMAAAA